MAIEHRHAVAMVAWAHEEFPAAELAGVLASTSICFDLSIFELFVPLGRGGKVILAANALELPSLPAAGEVTLINTVPSAMTELVRMAGVPDSVRTVNLAGEPLKNQLVQKIYEQETVAQVLNLYGPSEDTTYSTWATIPRGWTSGGAGSRARRSRSILCPVTTSPCWPGRTCRSWRSGCGAVWRKSGDRFQRGLNEQGIPVGFYANSCSESTPHAPK